MTADQTSADLREAITELLDVTTAALNDGSPAPSDLRHQVLLAILASESEHLSVINQLSEGVQIRSAGVLLRTMLEGWIIALYVTPDESDQCATSYVVKGLSEAKRFLSRIRALAEQNPTEQDTFLRPAGFTSRDDLDERIAHFEEDIERHRANAPKMFPPISACAESLGPAIELVYAQLYGLLLSDEVHVGAGAAFRRAWGSTVDSPERRAGTMRRTLFTAYSLYLDLVNLASQHLGRPKQGEMTRFANLREQLSRSM